MSKVNTRIAPYYESTDTETKNQYIKMLARPGRVAQAREITTLQGILLNIIKSFGDSIFSNGDIIEGCQVLISSDKRKATVTSGKIYLDGIVTEIPETVLDISGVGTEIIGVEINELIITEDSDPTLRDPAQGYDNYGQSGCDRLKRTLRLVVTDTNSPEITPIANLIDGELAVENYAPNYDQLTQTLARRTYDESGSYLVSGLKVHAEPRDVNNYNVVVESGKAYVLGYELKIPAARRLVNPRSNKSSSISTVEFQFSQDNLKYQLDVAPYVKSIEMVRGASSASDILTTSTVGVQVPLSNDNITRIVSVTQGGVDYTNTVDKLRYRLVRGSGQTRASYIEWLLGGDDAPVNGTSYTVTYEYTKDFMQGTDYKLTTDSSGSFVEFLDSGSHPLNNRSFEVGYYVYLARRDTVYIDQYGNIEILQGSPDERGFEVAPVAPVNTLTLAQIYNPPNGDVNTSVTSLNVSVSNIGLTRFTMNDIQNLLTRVKRTEYNQAVLSLNDDAKSRNTNTKKGIFTDPLIDLSRLDIYYNLDQSGAPIDASKPVYNMALDLDKGVASLPVNVFSYTFDGTSGTTHRYKRLTTLSTKGENIVLQQLNATKRFQINPYSVFPQLPEISVDPAIDSWVEERTVTVPISITNSRIVSTNLSILYDTVQRHVSGNRSWSETAESNSVSDKVVGSTVGSFGSTALISEESIMYMRPINITVEGNNFSPNLRDIRCTFDGIPVKLTPVGTTVPQDMISTDANGHFKAVIKVPNNVRTGSREVKIWSDTVVNNHINEAYTIFQSSGISRNMQRTITTVTTVLLQRETTRTVTTTNYIDPVGQTFVLDKLSVIKGIDVYFAARSTTNESVTLEVRSVVNGSIGSTIYASKTLRASEVKLSANASIPTRFNFDDPVVLDKETEYAFVLRSVSDKYEVWVSEIGGTDQSTGEIVLKNSYLTGVMMSSSNNSAWTAHQTTDIKFRIIEDIYEKSGSIIYEPIPVDSVTRLDLVAESVTLPGTVIDWYYSLDGINYNTIVPGTLRNLNSSTNEVILRADFRCNSSENLTPILASDTLLLVGTFYQLRGDYIGLNVTGLDTYTEVLVIMDTFLPLSTTTLEVFASPDNGLTMIPLELDTSQIKVLDNGWRENVYKKSNMQGATSCRIFIKARSDRSYATPKFSNVKVIMT